jgi:hypothetical protein
MNSGSIPDMGKKCISIPKRPDQPSESHSLSLHCNRVGGGGGSFIGSNRPRREADQPLPIWCRNQERVVLYLHSPIHLHGMYSGHLYIYIIRFYLSVQRNLSSRVMDICLLFLIVLIPEVYVTLKSCPNEVSLFTSYLVPFLWSPSRTRFMTTIFF